MTASNEPLPDNRSEQVHGPESEISEEPLSTSNVPALPLAQLVLHLIDNQASLWKKFEKADG
ncbi:MAG: hypothetical protein KDD42_09095, partial [Bdellovibrionales bacterium]|nr:hypothetical protein [Bdellovibrionales bacterium]